VQMFGHLWSQLARTRQCRIIQHNFAPPPRGLRGPAERLMPGSVANQIRLLNARLFEAGRGRVTWLDMEALASEAGARRFAPDRFFYNARLPFENRHLPLYLSAFRGAWRSALGRTKTGVGARSGQHALGRGDR
jgi:predicted enzyme involved in methoxymalonyl-ACP biosynthesis